MPEANLSTTDSEHQGVRAVRVEGESSDKLLKRKCTKDDFPEIYYIKKDRKVDVNTQDQEQNPGLNQAGSPFPPLSEHQNPASRHANSENHADHPGIVEKSDDCSREVFSEEDQTPFENHQLESTNDQQVRYKKNTI